MNHRIFLLTADCLDSFSFAVLSSQFLGRREKPTLDLPPSFSNRGLPVYFIIFYYILFYCVFISLVSRVSTVSKVSKVRTFFLSVKLHLIKFFGVGGPGGRKSGGDVCYNRVSVCGVWAWLCLIYSCS